MPITFGGFLSPHLQSSAAAPQLVLLHHLIKPCSITPSDASPSPQLLLFHHSNQSYSITPTSLAPSPKSVFLHHSNQPSSITPTSPVPSLQAALLHHLNWSCSITQLILLHCPSQPCSITPCLQNFPDTFKSFPAAFAPCASELMLQRLGVSGLRAEGRAVRAALEVEKGRHRQQEEQLWNSS